MGQNGRGGILLFQETLRASAEHAHCETPYPYYSAFGTLRYLFRESCPKSEFVGRPILVAKRRDNKLAKKLSEGVPDFGSTLHIGIFCPIHSDMSP